MIDDMLSRIDATLTAVDPGMCVYPGVPVLPRREPGGTSWRSVEWARAREVEDRRSAEAERQAAGRSAEAHPYEPEWLRRANAALGDVDRRPASVVEPLDADALRRRFEDFVKRRHACVPVEPPKPEPAPVLASEPTRPPVWWRRLFRREGRS